MDHRVEMGIQEMDAMLGGGFLPETVNLVEGAAGTGKTTFGLQFIYNGITRFDEPGLILTFESFPSQFYQDALSFGWDLRALEDAGKLRIVMTSPEMGGLIISANSLFTIPSVTGVNWALFSFGSAKKIPC